MKYLRSASVVFVMVMSLVIAAAVSIQAESDADTAKRDDIRELLRIMKTREVIEQSLTQTVVNMKQAMPTVTVETWEKVLNEIDLDELVEMYVPIYDKYLTHEDIQGLIRFYQTDLGKRFMDVQPEINMEMMKVGQVWGQELGQKVMNEMGY
ncbi:MAG TPA: DUF2059 domain-containing protein [bacterium]|nr:DUF2059 domain-containing protein [bacterium]